MAIGNYAAAAEAYEQLARGAQARGIARDVQLFMQAGRCHIMAGQVQPGMADLKQGLTTIARRGNFQHLQNAGQRTIAELNQRGLTAEAAEIESLVKGAIPATFTTAPAGAPAKPRLLPPSCPGCGGPVRSDEVEWIDEATAECPFCGGAIRAE
jgi:hypothetical protein